MPMREGLRAIPGPDTRGMAKSSQRLRSLLRRQLLEPERSCMLPPVEGRVCAAARGP